MIFAERRRFLISSTHNLPPCKSRPETNTSAFRKISSTSFFKSRAKVSSDESWLMNTSNFELIVGLRVYDDSLRHFQFHLRRHLRHVFVAAAGKLHDGELVFHGSEIPKSRQIFRARNLLISVCLGTAERRLAAGLPHQEWSLPSRIRTQPCAARCRINSRLFTQGWLLLRNLFSQPPARLRD